MRVLTIIAIATMGCATMVAAQTEVLTPPTSVEKAFVLTDEFVTLSSAEAVQVGYPIWQKVGMGKNENAVPANWCRPLFLAKPWLIEAFGGTLAKAEESCWLSTSLVTAELEEVEVPESSKTNWTVWWDVFWKNRPDDFVYWVPAFSVTHTVFASTMGVAPETAVTFDPTPLVNRIGALEEKVAAAEATANAAQVAAATNALDISRLKKDVAGLKTQSLPASIEASLWGFPWWQWLAAVTFGLLTLMLLGFLVRRRRRQKDQQRLAAIDSKLATTNTNVNSVGEQVGSLEKQARGQAEVINSLRDDVAMLQETTLYLVEHSMSGRIVVDGFTYEALNSLQPGESLPDFKMAKLNGGNPIGAQHVRLTRENDSEDKPLLRIEGAFKPEEATIPAKKNRQGEWHFTVTQVLAKLNQALEKGEIHGLGKPDAAEFCVKPGTQRPKVKPASRQLTGCDEFAKYAAELDAERVSESSSSQGASESQKISGGSTIEKPPHTESASQPIEALADVILNPAKRGREIPSGIARLVKRMAEAKGGKN